jgi:hypothetical protein
MCVFCAYVEDICVYFEPMFSTYVRVFHIRVYFERLLSTYVIVLSTLCVCENIEHTCVH